MATHSSILAWRIPWTEEPGGLQSTGRKEPDTTEQLHSLRFRSMTTPRPITVAHGEDYLSQFSYKCNPDFKRWSEFPQNLGPNMQEGRFSEEYPVFFEEEKALDTGGLPWWLRW